ncbi:MAG: hypothetical protein Q8896_07455 [Bacteroidota bacterium]|nr:hypothetical protein [Bacteroidota bacterium]MDP4236545.1 hypothetical protein [Bacteroidota bacterium]
MVRAFAISIFFTLLLFEKTGYGQILSDSANGSTGLTDLFDASELSNQVFLRTSEEIFGQELQFLTDDFERLSMSPVQINNASWKDLQLLPALSDLDRYRILNDRRNGVLPETEISAASKYFLSGSAKRAGQHVLIRSRIVLDPGADTQAVYRSGSYRGSPLKTVSRIIVNTDDILFSFVEAKDPGEPLYFDHLTGCLALTHSIPITENVALAKCVLGDYSLSFGNGLLFASGYSQLPSHGANLNVMPRAGGIEPYVSSSSFRYFRGAAGEISAGIFSLSGFYSERMIDATIDSNVATSISSTGYHRTAAELARRDALQSTVIGEHFSITPLNSNNYFSIGASGYTLSYNKPIMPVDSTSLGFRGMHHSMVSIDMHGILSFLSWSGEYAQMNSDAGKAHALAISLLGAPLEILEISMNYRELPSTFISPFGGTFGINASDVQNETGWYLGSKLTLLPRVLWVYASGNFSRSLSIGTGMLHYSDLRIGGKYSMHSIPLQLLFELRTYGRGMLFSLAGDSLSKTSLRLDADLVVSSSIHLGVREEIEQFISQHDNTKSNGNLIGVKIRYAPIRELTIGSGIIFFHADSYAARFYSNEADFPGAAVFVALYGTGYRYYLQCAGTILNSLVLEARIAETDYASIPGGQRLRKMTAGVQLDLAF